MIIEELNIFDIGHWTQNGFISFIHAQQGRNTTNNEGEDIYVAGTSPTQQSKNLLFCLFSRGKNALIESQIFSPSSRAGYGPVE